MQQEFKWSWEQMMDEMAEAIGMDPVKFRLLNVQHPGTKVSHAQGGPTVTPMPESVNETLTYDSYAVEEVCAEGTKEIGWEKRNRYLGGTQVDTSAGSAWRYRSTTRDVSVIAKVRWASRSAWRK
jgi:CO/xanthine dehydrogenase Mo-binding subunit